MFKINYNNSRILTSVCSENVIIIMNQLVTHRYKGKGLVYLNDINCL